MNSVRVYIVPVFCSNKVTKRIFEIMCNNFWITRCSGTKHHKHMVVSAGVISFSFIHIAKARHFFVKTVPTISFAMCNNLNFNCRTVFSRKLCLMSGITICSTNNSFNTCRFKSVIKIMLNQKICCRNCNCTYFMKC